VTRGKASNGVFIIESMFRFFVFFLGVINIDYMIKLLKNKKPIEAFLGVIEHRLYDKIIKMPFEVNHRFPAS